jgi:para-aminobenzoate synthetase/4-amino-4-deoxychorismate lyase
MQILVDFCDPKGADAGLRCAFETPQQVLIATTPEQVKPLLNQVDALSQQGWWCVGYVRYEAAPAFDTALVVHPSDGPLAWFGVFKETLPWPEPHPTDTQATPADNPAKAAPDPQHATSPTLAKLTWHTTLGRADFNRKMAQIHQAIAAGEFYQVNYTAPLQGEFVGAPLDLFHRLQLAQPGGFAAFVDSGFEQVLSVSPELFFDWQPGLPGQTGAILTRPMKGTAPRGTSAEEDVALTQALVASAKERAENVMIVDLLRNDLSRIAEPFSVKVPSLFKVQTLPTVFQMVSDVTATTRPGTRLGDVFTALFPCGSITGAPKVQAMRSIKALEPAPRGIYCGAIGVVRPGGHATFSVAIRTVTLRGQQATCGIGSGITSDATPDAEWQEWQHKRGFLDRASAPFKLLETLRLENGKYTNLIAHLSRLESTARHFGYVFDATRVTQALNHLAADTQTEEAVIGALAGAWRVRLQTDASGQPEIEKYALNSPEVPVALALAAMPFEAAHSEFTRFKTTRRDHYEAFTPTDPAVFDTLLFNTAGQITECTRGNVALLIDGHWVTPPLHCGLLGGVGRAAYLKQGRLREAVVRVEDLPRVQALAFINSLRGWLDARLV